MIQWNSRRLWTSVHSSTILSRVNQTAYSFDCCCRCSGKAQQSRLKSSWTSGSGYWDHLAAQSAQESLDPHSAAGAASPWTCKKRELTRDFIHRSLYDRTLGYFSNPKLEILSPAEPLDWSQFRNYTDFLTHFHSLYASRTSEDESLRSGLSPSETEELNNASRPNDYSFLSTYARSQVWHTPTELFQPWFGFAVASYIVSQYSKRLETPLVSTTQEEKNSIPLIIYEMGPGNGTLMLNILDYLQAHYPEIYNHTEYYLIEISSKLASNLSKEKNKKNASKFKIIQKSILEWDHLEKRPCFVLAMEVIVSLLFMRKTAAFTGL
jgi:hypothetical protein